MGIWGGDESLNVYLRYFLLILGAVLFLIVAPLLLRVAFQIRRHYLDYFYASITPQLTKGEYRSFSFIRRPERKMLTMPLRKVLSCTPELDGDSFFKGEVEGATFYSFGYSYAAKSGNRTFEAEGRYIEFTLNTSFPFELIIKDRRSASYYKKKPLLLRLKSDSSSFDDVHGTYPYVTSSSPLSNAIPFYCGIPVNSVENTLGIVKAYTTRVGAGPFPSEILDVDKAHIIREKGHDDYPFRRGGGGDSHWGSRWSFIKFFRRSDQFRFPLISVQYLGLLLHPAFGGVDSKSFFFHPLPHHLEKEAD